MLTTRDRGWIELWEDSLERLFAPRGMRSRNPLRINRHTRHCANRPRARTHLRAITH